MKKEFINYLDNLRGIAIAMVVIGHIPMLSGLYDYHQYVFQNATAIFIFIAGFFFTYGRKEEFDYKKFMVTKFKNVMLPYFILGSIAAFASIYFGGYEYLELSKLQYYLWVMCIGGGVVGPLWFMPMIFLFYLIAPLLNCIAYHKALPVVTLITMLISIFTYRPVDSFNPMLVMIHFLGFYILGIYFERNREKFEGRSSILLLFGSVTFLVGVYVYWLYNIPRETIFFIDNIGRINGHQLSKLAIILILIPLLNNYIKSRVKLFSMLAKYSFGIFFIHGFWIVIFLRLFAGLIENPALLFPLELLFVSIGTAFSIYFAKVILKSRSRYVIGC